MHYDLITDIALSSIEKPFAKVLLIELAKYSNGSGECFPFKRHAVQWQSDTIENSGSHSSMAC